MSPTVLQMQGSDMVTHITWDNNMKKVCFWGLKDLTDLEIMVQLIPMEKRDNHQGLFFFSSLGYFGNGRQSRTTHMCMHV